MPWRVATVVLAVLLLGQTYLWQRAESEGDAAYQRLHACQDR